MDTFLRDVRQGLKLLVREKTFSFTILLTLAVCIGANVAIFSVIRTVILDPLPFDEADRIVTVYNSYPGAGSPRGANGTVDFFQRRENIDAFDEVALMQGSAHTVGEAGSTDQVMTMRVTPSFFPLIRVQAVLGRTFAEEEMEAGNERKVLLTHGYWEEHFGGAADAVGKTLRIDGTPHTVIGVLPEDFLVPTRAQTRFFVPVAFTEADRAMDRWHSNNYQMMARLAPGASVEQAAAQNAALNDALIDQWPIPNARQLLDDVGYSTVVVPAADDLIRDARPVLYMLWAGVGFVLLIGCVNIANLMLARGQTRIGEVATQLALGASRNRVARQLGTEAMVLGMVGGVVGLALGAVGLDALLGLGAADLPRGTEIGIDGMVVAFTLLISLGAALAFGAIPVGQVMRSDLSPVFRTEGRTGTASRRAVMVRNGLVTGQVALAFVMLIGSSLMLMSFRSALAVDPGFEPEEVLTAFVSLPESRYEDGEARMRFWDLLRAESEGVPALDDLAITTQLPFSGNNSNSVIMPEGYVPPPGESLLSPYQTNVGPRYFETLGIELVEGRTFLDTDGPGAPRVIVIDEWLANRYWPDRSPIGDRMVYGAVPGMDSIPEDALYTVVGVVGTIKQNDLTAPEAEHVGAYYFSYRQQPRPFMSLVATPRTGPAAALASDLRALVARLDPELPLFSVQTMQNRIDESLAGRRVPMILLGVFAGVALFLAVVGIYGALAYSVTQRRREIGIRLAMGSSPGDVFRAIVGQGLRVTGVGLVVGAGAAWFLARLIQSLLFDVQATDPRALIAGAAVLLAAGVVACVVPARRATGVNPVDVLGG